MNTIFMNSENSKTSDLHSLLLNLSDKINLIRRDKYVALSNLSIYYNGKRQKNHTKIMNLKHKLQHRMKSFNYLMDHILFQMFEDILNIS